MNLVSMRTLAFVLACASLCSLPAQDLAEPPIAGIGVVLRAKGTNIVVQGILPGTSAASQAEQVHVGDRILAVAQDGAPAVPVDGAKIKQAVDMIRGPAGTSVSLTLASPVDDGSPSRIVRFTRATLKLPPPRTPVP